MNRTYGVERLVIRRRAAFAGGASFGEAGAYERIEARAHFAVDPQAPAQSHVFDITLAPRGEDGLVRFSADLFILKPTEMDRANGALLLEFPNRGNKRFLQFYNDAPGTNDPSSLADGGNAYLMRRGYTVVSAAWQGDVLAGDGRLTMDLPAARNSDGSSLTASIRSEYICDAPGITFLPLSGKNGTRSHPTISLDTEHAELRRRRYPWSTPTSVHPDAWAFARVEGGGAGGAGDISGAERAIVPSDSHIYVAGGFQPGWIYELIYNAKDPLVLDLGFVGIRDVVSFLRNSAGESNPLSGRITRTYGWGRSQSGRAIRDYIHRGYNADAEGRKVFDGMLSHIAGAGRTTMNRFSNLVVAASRQYEDWLNPADRFPFSYARSVDHLTGEEDGILKRPETDPLVIHTQTASEYWYRRGSLVHTDTRGNDLPQPDTTRIFFWSSSQHWSDPAPSKPLKGVCQNYQNVVATSALFRSTLELMEGWVLEGRAPPPSRHPRREDATLVTFDRWREEFPAIPGTAVPARPNELPRVDYGPAFATGGPAAEPPIVDTATGYAVLLPSVDPDGNDVAGLRVPMVSAPLGTYTGWNLRIPGHGAGALHDFSGSYIPFPETSDERRLTGDPRHSIIERYGSAEAYVSAVRSAASELAALGFFLEEDVERAALAAADWGRARHVVYLSTEDEMETERSHAAPLAEPWSA